MATTPQTNTTLEALAQALLGCDDFVICGHTSPDGDCLGSQLALAAALQRAGKRVTCVLAKDDPIDAGLTFMPGADDLVPAAQFTGVAHTFVGVDVPTRERVGQAAAAIRDTCDIAFTIDHHAVDTTMADYVYVDPDAASTTMLIWRIAELMGVDRSGAVATCCYTGLVTDTGRFQFQNTDADALVAAAQMVQAGADPAAVSRSVFQNRSLPSVQLEGLAIDRVSFGADNAYALSWLARADFERLGAQKSDSEPIVNVLRSIRGVRVACMLREQDGVVRGSFRAKDDTDVAAIARSFGGGGHVAAAGFTLKMSLPEARALVRKTLDEAVCGA